MDITSLTAFLTSAKENVAKVEVQECYVVMGNESVDLDSVVSSIVMGYYTAHSLAQKAKENETEPEGLVFSVINCKREDFPLRTESVYYLGKLGIPVDQLICRDEINLEGLHTKGKLKLTLVDHNVLGSGDVKLESSVTRIVDHHKTDRESKPEFTIEVVGSCCTLVAEVVLHVFASDRVVCELLYGTILLDTVNLSPAAAKTTVKDLKMISDLEAAIGPENLPNKNELFQALVAARSDVSQLTTAQLLRKDTKDIRFADFSIALPSVPMSAEKFLKLQNVLEDLKTCMEFRNVKALVILTLDVDQVSGEMKRDIIFHTEQIEKAQEIRSVLEKSDLKAELKHDLTNIGTNLFVYKQGNVGLSRKYVIPLLEAYFSGGKTEASGETAKPESMAVTIRKKFCVVL